MLSVVYCLMQPLEVINGGVVLEVQRLESVRIERVRDSHPRDLLWRGLPPQVVERDQVLDQLV
jgi:hypothetical protein